jgi:hypothetical protein
MLLVGERACCGRDTSCAGAEEYSVKSYNELFDHAENPSTCLQVQVKVRALVVACTLQMHAKLGQYKHWQTQYTAGMLFLHQVLLTLSGQKMYKHCQPSGQTIWLVAGRTTDVSTHAPSI